MIASSYGCNPHQESIPGTAAGVTLAFCQAPSICLSPTLVLLTMSQTSGAAAATKITLREHAFWLEYQESTYRT